MNATGDYYRALVSGQQRGWWPSTQRGVLWVASVAYGCGTAWRNFLFDRGWTTIHRSSVPVVSIGNLTLGGTGKTPCVEYVARFYRQRNRRVAILSRGYGRNRRRLGDLGDLGGKSDLGDNDEAMVLAENLTDVPHLQGADRAALAKSAVEKLKSEVLVLDDGFQHRRLERDLDLVLIDATQPWGHGFLFPRGLLRESTCGLRRAGMVLMTRCDQATDEDKRRIRERIAQAVPGLSIAETAHVPVDLVNSDRATAPLARIASHPVAALCGIGNPEAFRRTLIDLGASVTAFRTFADHHAYDQNDLDDLDSWSLGLGAQLPADCIVVTTQKDLVKLRRTRIGDRELWALRVQLEILSERETLERKLAEVLH